MFKKNLAALSVLFSALFIFQAAAFGQETEAAASSELTGVSLPAGAQRVLPASHPAEVSETMDKIIAAGGGKLRKGETEVLVWTGSKSNTGGVMNRLASSLKTAGWQYSVEGSEGGVTIFSLFKDGANRRALVGFYGATDDALILSWMEVLAGGGGTVQSSNDSQTDEPDTAPVRNTRGSVGGNIVGTWTNGSMSMLGEKYVNGTVQARNGSTFKWVFTADGRFESIGLINSTMYGCTTSLFNDKRGRYEISGSQITLVPSKNFWRNTYSCSPSSNKERDYVLERETYDFRLKTDEYGKTLVCLANAKGESCYRRED